VESVIRSLRALAAPGRIVVASTHDQRLVPMADRVVELGPKPSEETAVNRQVVLEAGEVLFEQGTRGELIYTVETGRVELIRLRADGTEECLHISVPGEYFGELSPLLGFPRAATARALEPTTLAAHTVGEFRARVGPEALASVLGREPAPS
jgi:putative ABC transport system ATP-binding protein